MSRYTCHSYYKITCPHCLHKHVDAKDSLSFIVLKLKYNDEEVEYECHKCEKEYTPSLDSDYRKQKSN